MKHVLRIFAAGAALLAVSCTKEQSDGERIPESFSSDSHYVNVDEARAAVETMLGSMDPETRGGAVRSITGVVTIGGPGDTRGGASDSPVYHVFSLGDGEGFALASGDDRTPPVFCITDSGTFEEIAETGNPGLGMTLLNYDINYRVAVGLPIPDEGDGMIYPGEPGYPSASAYGSGGGITDVDIDYGGGVGNNITRKTYPWELSGYKGTQVACNWGQGEPYHLMMPMISANKHAYAGCGAVAVAQILYHYGYPSSIDGYALDWNKISKHRSIYSCDTTVYPAIARLFERLNSQNYLQATVRGSSGTFTNTNRITPTFQSLGYSCVAEADYSAVSLLKAIMTDGRPVMVFGMSHRTPKYILGKVSGYDYSDGHYWVCDRVMTYKQKIETYNWSILLRTDYEYLYYVHCNWGWDGSHNGYFLPNEFDAAHEPAKPDTRAVEGEENYYQFRMKMWHQIKR